MRLPAPGAVARTSLGVYLLLGLCMAVAALVGSRSRLMGLLFVGIFNGGLFALVKLFPDMFGDKSPSRVPRMNVWRVLVFILTLAGLLAGYFLVLDASWAASHGVAVTVGLLACSLFAMSVLEARWARQDRAGWTRRNMF